MENDRARQFRDMIQDPAGHTEKEYPEQVRKYETANRFSRWLIKRRYPMVADRYDFIKAQESVTEARLAASRDPHNEVPLRSTATSHIPEEIRRRNEGIERVQIAEAYALPKDGWTL